MKIWKLFSCGEEERCGCPGSSLRCCCWWTWWETMAGSHMGLMERKLMNACFEVNAKCQVCFLLSFLYPGKFTKLLERFYGQHDPIFCLVPPPFKFRVSVRIQAALKLYTCCSIFLRHLVVHQQQWHKPLRWVDQYKNKEVSETSWGMEDWQ